MTIVAAFVHSFGVTSLRNYTQVSMTVVAAFIQTFGVASLRIARRYWQDFTSAVLFHTLACPLHWSEHIAVGE